MGDQSQNKVDMSLDDIIKLNKKEKRQAQKSTGPPGRGRGQRRGQSQPRGMGRGMQGKVTGKGQKQQRQFIRQGRGRGRINTSSSSQNINRASMRGVNQAVVSRIGRGRGRGRGIAQQKQKGGNAAVISRQPSLQNVQNLRGIGRGKPKLGAAANKKNQLIFTNSARRQHRSQQLSNVKTQATLIREKEAALKNLQQAKRNMQSINKAIQQTARDNVVNQKRGLNTNGTQMGRGRGRGRAKLLTGLMNKTVSMQNLLSTSSRQMMNTSVTISNPIAAKRKRQWRTQKSNVVLQVDNRSRVNAAPKAAFLDQLKKLKPTEPTVYKFQKNMFAVPSTSLSLNDRFSSKTTTDNSGDGRKVFV